MNDVQEPEVIDDFEFATDEHPKYNAIFYILKNPKTGRLFIPDMFFITKDEYNRIQEMRRYAREMDETPPQELVDYKIMNLGILSHAAKNGFIADDQQIKDFKERTLPRIKLEKKVRKFEKIKARQTTPDNINMYQWKIDHLNKEIDATDKTEEDLLEEFLRDVQIPPEDQLAELNRWQENYSLQVGTNDEWKIRDEVSLMKALRQHYKVTNPKTGKMDVTLTEEEIIKNMYTIKHMPISDADWETIQKEIQEDLKFKKELLKQLIELRDKLIEDKSNSNFTGDLK